MNEAHLMDDIQGQNHFRRVEFRPFFRHFILAHQVNHISTRHVVHNHVEELGILKGVMKLPEKMPLLPPILLTTIHSQLTCTIHSLPA